MTAGWEQTQTQKSFPDGCDAGLIYENCVKLCFMCMSRIISESLQTSFGNVVLHITAASCPQNFITYLQKTMCGQDNQK